MVCNVLWVIVRSDFPKYRYIEAENPTKGQIESYYKSFIKYEENIEMLI